MTDVPLIAPVRSYDGRRLVPQAQRFALPLLSIRRCDVLSRGIQLVAKAGCGLVRVGRDGSTKLLGATDASTIGAAKAGHCLVTCVR